MAKRDGDVGQVAAAFSKNKRTLLLPATDICNGLFMKLLSGSFRALPKERKI